MDALTNVLPYIQIGLGIVLTALVITQQSDAGLGLLGGGGGETTNHTRRGIEKTIFEATIVVAVLFSLSCFLSIVF